MIVSFGILNNAVISALQIALAVLIMHRAIPSVLHESKIRAWRLWALGMTSAIFSLSYFTDFIAGRTVGMTHIIAQYLFLTYCLLRYVGVIKREGLRLWGQPPIIKEDY